MKKMKLSDVVFSGSRLLPEHLGDRKITNGGLAVLKPGETPHPDPGHVHDTEEVFIILQGAGTLPLNDDEYHVETGDVIIVEAGEDHHLTSSVDDPLAVAWYMMEK